MNEMTPNFGTLYHPLKAFLIYGSGDRQYYVEAYDISDTGTPVNAHPLSAREAGALSKALRITEQEKKGSLYLNGLLPANVLYFRGERSPMAIWQTPACTKKLFFQEALGIPSGECALPSLLWKATKNHLSVCATLVDGSVTADTPLYHAPFFNVYENTTVCMGDTQFTLPPGCPLDTFISIWEEAFFNSFFSHMVEGHNPVNGNLVQLWQSLSDTRRPFPYKCLRPIGKATVQNLIPRIA